MLEAQALALKFAYKMNSQDSFFSFQLHPLHPFTFLHGAVIPILNGASVFMSDQTAVSDLMPTLSEGKATRLIVNPKYLEEFSKATLEAKLKWPRLKSITPIKNIVNANLREKIKEAFPSVKILQHYGCVETGFAATMVTLDNDDLELKLGGVLPGIQVRLLDAQGNDIKPGSGEVGEIVISGKVVTSGYLKAHNDDQKYSFRGSSFFTGDMGLLLKSGQLVLAGQKSCMAQHQGKYIQSLMVEEKVRSIPGIAEVLLLGLTNRMGKPTKLLIVQRESGREIPSAEILKFCQDNLPEPLQPNNLVIVNEIPINPWGAVDRDELAKIWAGAA
jgi:acyl-CoA synthetase (AMP-forming)/AMP-acid ligase II